MRSFYEEWKFRHPLPDDLKHSFEKTSGKDLDWFFDDAINEKKKIDFRPSGPVLLPHGEDLPKYKKKLSISLVNRLESNEKYRLYILPALAWNEHNNFMAGAYFFNKNFVRKRVEFNIMPLYSFNNESLNGFYNILGRVPSHGKYLYRTDIGLSTVAFDHKPYGQLNHYTKIKPKVVFNFKNPNKPGSNAERSAELSYYYIQSDGPSARNFRENRSSFIVGKWKWDRKSVINNTKYEAGFEYGRNGIGLDSTKDNFVKLFAEVQQKVNYNQKKKFLKLRLFGAAFISKSNNLSSRYNIFAGNNNGFSDYLFDDLFLERNSPIDRGLLSRQLEQNNAAMRNTVPLAADKWMIGANIETTLPGILPIRAFMDLAIGDSDAANSGLPRQEIIYTGGLSLVVLEDIFEVYFPVVFSDHIESYYDATDASFFERVTFKLSIPLMNPFKFDLL